jgi:creatinine amidohydrolase
MRRFLVLLVTILCCSSVWGQNAPHMRTRLLTSLTNTEIEQYLKRNDVIFIPIGNVEPHGGMPIDCEYVGPLAIAMKAAEEVDGLVLPGLAYFFPDATVVGRGAVHVTPSEGTAFLKPIAKSLLRQGFRRQIYLSGHAPSFQTISPLVREIFDETHVPILYLENGLRPPGSRFPSQMGGMTSMASARPTIESNTQLIGAYLITGRLEDVPINLSQEVPVHPANPGVDNLFPVGVQSGAIGFYMTDPTDHGGPALPMTAEQRSSLANKGAASIEEGVKAGNLKEILQAMRDYDKFIQQNIIPKYGWMFPGDKQGQ